MLAVGSQVTRFGPTFMVYDGQGISTRLTLGFMGKSTSNVLHLMYFSCTWLQIFNGGCCASVAPSLTCTALLVMR